MKYFNSKARKLSIAAIALLAFWRLGYPNEEPGTKQVPRLVTISSDESLKFSQFEIRAKRNEPLQIQFANKASKAQSEILHSLAFVNCELSADQAVAATINVKEDLSLPDEILEICIGSTPVVAPGGSYELTLNAPSEKGRYTFLCTLPGHAYLGMRGTLIVD